MNIKFQLLVSLIFTLFITVNASAATVLVFPATGASIAGLNALLNVTTDSGLVAVNITFYAQSASTANSTWVMIRQILNYVVVNNADITTRFNTTILEDASDYSFNVTVSNASTMLASVANTGITIDNSVPTIPTLTSPTNNNINTSKGTTTFSADVNDASTTACTYSIGRGGTSSTSQDTISGDGTYSVGTCTFTRAFSTSSSNGDWHWIIIASDGTNTTSSNPFVYSVQIAGSGGGSGSSSGIPPVYVANDQGQLIPFISKISKFSIRNNPMLTGIIVLVVIIVATIVVISSSGKKRRRR